MLHTMQLVDSSCKVLNKDHWYLLSKCNWFCRTRQNECLSLEFKSYPRPRMSHSERFTERPRLVCIKQLITAKIWYTHCQLKEVSCYQAVPPKLTYAKWYSLAHSHVPGDIRAATTSCFSPALQSAWPSPQSPQRSLHHHKRTQMSICLWHVRTGCQL